jgi:O-antigen/teichoic acid export membrane protein
MISTGRYCLAIVLPKQKEDAQRLLLISSILTFVVSVVFLIILLFTRDWFFPALNVEILDSYVFLIAFNVLFIGLYESIYYYALRNKEYKILSTNIIIQVLVVISLRLVLGYFSKTEYGLLLSHLLGYAISYILLFVRLGIYEFNISKLFQNIGELLKKYINFPKFSLFADILSMSANLSPNLFLNTIFGSASTGYYSMSDKFLGSPIWLITSSVGDVFKQEASEQYRERGSIYSIFIKTTKTLLVLGVIAFLLIFIFVPYLIPILLGPGWEEVGVFIRIFSIMYLAKFVVTPVSYITYIVNRQKLNIIFQSMRFGSLIGPFIWGYFSKDLYSTLISWSILTTISYIIIFFISLNIAKKLQNKKPESIVIEESVPRIS